MLFKIALMEIQCIHKDICCCRAKTQWDCPCVTSFNMELLPPNNRRHKASSTHVYVKPKCTKATDMRFHWLRDRGINQILQREELLDEVCGERTPIIHHSPHWGRSSRHTHQPSHMQDIPATKHTLCPWYEPFKFDNEGLESNKNESTPCSSSACSTCIEVSIRELRTYRTIPTKWDYRVFPLYLVGKNPSPVNLKMK